ncbi:class I SAM-dependent DNA methyltransferase [Halarcobacter sp.]|uniref:type I restriction-modification system subunit M n=1 Tax=Halarcobacter sp. TaxID=2321133 RepID=UPI002AAB8DB9|nr:class I SAM-dependent DNA methyltransferase [Halarcobacter sp.]
MINKDKLNNLTNEIWKSAERLRGKFKAYEYQNVIMPMIVIRRLECVLLDGRKKIAEEKLQKNPDISKEDLEKFVKTKEMSNSSPLPFSNSSNWTLEKIDKEDHTQMESNFRDYIKGFSDNVQEIINKFDFRAVIGQLVNKDRLAPIISQYSKEPLGPEYISNLEMGYIYEELLRKFSEQSGEEAGEHFTPREVIRLMVELLDIKVTNKRISIYDPACGTGGMLSVAKEHLLENASNEEEKENIDKLVTLYGQELQDQNYAICQSDMLIKGDKNSLITCGNSLVPDDETAKERGDQHEFDNKGKKRTFDYMLSNPPFGVTWGGKDGYAKKVELFKSTRYSAGLPRSNDGALLFLQTIIDKMKPKKEGGSKVAIVFNGSPLSNGDCGSGESEIRRDILERDLLEAIVMLPDQLFYNTGIFTYIWILSNNKEEHRKNKVQLIDARQEWEKEPKSFGNKRKRMTQEHRDNIYAMYKEFECESCKIFDTKDFAYHKVSVTFWQTDENENKAYKTSEFTKALTPSNFKAIQEYYKEPIEFKVKGTAFLDKEFAFTLTLKADKPFMTHYNKELKKIFKSEFKNLDAKEITALIKSFDVEIFYTHPHFIDDTEYIPFGKNIEKFLNDEIGKEIIRFKDAPQLGYEILPNKYFYKYEAPKPTEKLLKEFWDLEEEAEKILISMGKEIQ